MTCMELELAVCCLVAARFIHGPSLLFVFLCIYRFAPAIR